MSTSILAVLTEATDTTEIGPEPVAVGLFAFVALCLALFLVTRLNRDR